MLSYDDDCQRKGRLWWLRMVTSPSCVGRRPDMRDRLGKVRAALWIIPTRYGPITALHTSMFRGANTTVLLLQRPPTT